MLSLNSSTCLAIGYLTLYSFTAFSFWINAMAANIFFKFSSMLSMSSSEASSGWKLFLYSLYAQGMPLVLCLVVGLLDRFGSCDITRPHMGTSQCFLGKPWGEHLEERNQTTGQWTAFFYSPEFIYFYSVVLALQAANVIFFLLTVYYLVQHWRNSAGIIKTETKGNFIIVLKLFFIMGNVSRHRETTITVHCPQVFPGWGSLSLTSRLTRTDPRAPWSSGWSSTFSTYLQ